MISAFLVAAFWLRPAPPRSAPPEEAPQATAADGAQYDPQPPSREASVAAASDSTSPRTPPHLRAQRLEAALASPAGLSLRAARRESATEADFDRLLTTLHDGYHADPEASATQRLFERQIGSAFRAGDTGIALDRIACGLSVCAAKFIGRQTASMKFLDTLMGSGQDGKARIYSSNIRIVPPAAGDDRIGYRVIFSTDPATATLVEQR